MLTLRPILTRTLQHWNAAGTQLSACIVLGALFSIVATGAGSAWMVSKMIDDAGTVFGSAVAERAREQISIQYFFPVQMGSDDLQTVLAGLVQDKLLQEGAKDQAKALVEADKQVQQFLLSETIVLVPWMAAFAFIWAFVTMVIRGAIAALASDSRLGLHAAFIFGLRIWWKLLLQALWIGFFSLLISVPMGFLALSAQSQFVLACALALMVGTVILVNMRLFFATAFLVQDGQRVFQSLRSSWQLTQGRVLQVASMLMNAGLMFLVCIFAFQFALQGVMHIAQMYSPYAVYLTHVSPFIGAVAGTFITVFSFRMKEILVASSR